MRVATSLIHYKGQFMYLTLEIDFDGRCHQAARLDLKDKVAGYRGAPSKILDRAMGRSNEIADSVLAACR